VDFLNKGNIMGREAAEKKREKELVKLRKKYLAKKGKKPAAKKKATKPKLTGREAVEAKRQEKLEALSIAAKTRKALKEDKKSTAPKKSVRPKARSITSSSLSPSKSVRPKVNPKSQKGYYVDKKQGNKMVRVFPNMVPGGWKKMTDAERVAKGFPTKNSRKYSIDYNQNKDLTFNINN